MTDFTKFKSLLEEQMTFPDYYTFKFIVNESTKTVVTEALIDHQIEIRTSKNGKYTSITSRKLVNTSHEVIEIYQEIGKIDGVITL